MKILILGAGGREDAFAWKLAQSPRCSQLFIAPGNAGTARHGTNVNLDISDFEAVFSFVTASGIDWVVVGPELPLVDGIADFLSERGVPVIGPVQSAARLEGSKEFSKAFMQKYGIPTASYASFTESTRSQALEYIDQHPLPVVIKASGLAAGKGVLICESRRHAREVVQDMLSGSAFGEAGKTVVIEEFLQGIEISVFVLTDGKHYKLLPSAKDYKRIGEGDAGLNTGGMGAVSPVPFADQAFIDSVERTIVKPTLDGLQAEGINYKGFIFIGLMVVDGIPYVLEYNVRMGDPETEVVLPRLQSDLVDLFEGVVNDNLQEKELSVDPRTCATVMLVSGGYPGDYQKGKEMSGLSAEKDTIFFHAGTTTKEGKLLTNGGRVLAISSYGQNISDAVNKSLTHAEIVKFEGKYYRRDIGRDLINLTN